MLKLESIGACLVSYQRTESEQYSMRGSRDGVAKACCLSRKRLRYFEVDVKYSMKVWSLTKWLFDVKQWRGGLYRRCGRHYSEAGSKPIHSQLSLSQISVGRITEIKFPSIQCRLYKASTDDACVIERFTRLHFFVIRKAISAYGVLLVFAEVKKKSANYFSSKLLLILKIEFNIDN